MAKILIIDDSPTDVRVLSVLLEKAGHVVSAESSAEDGIEHVLNDRPDAIIMDVIMPGMNGFQATRSLSKDPATRDVPILIVTTKSMETDRVWGLRQGARDFVTKPINEGDFLTRINKLLQDAG